MTVAQKNRRLGLFLGVVVVSLFAYSFFIIHARGTAPEPQGLTKLQKIWRGL